MQYCSYADIEKIYLNERVKLLWLVVTFLRYFRWESRRLANLRRQRQSTACDCRLSDENRANKEIDIIWRSSSANVLSEVSEEFNVNDPRYRRQLEDVEK